MADKQTQNIGNDDFLLGFHDGHNSEELAAMSYIQLCSEIEHSKPGSTRRMLLESEKLRRDSKLIIHDPTDNEAAHPTGTERQPERNWWEKPIGQIGIGIVAQHRQVSNG